MEFLVRVILDLDHLQGNGSFLPAMFLVGLVPWFCLLLSIGGVVFLLKKSSREQMLPVSGALSIGVSLIAIQYGRFAGFASFLPVFS